MNSLLSDARRDLEARFRDPTLARLTREAMARAAGDLRARPDTDLSEGEITQLLTWDAIAGGDTSELFEPMVGFLLHAFTDEVLLQQWIGKFEVAVVESLGLVPSIFKVDAGFVILIPTGFLDVLERVQYEVERLTNGDVYDVNPDSTWLASDLAESIHSVSRCIESALRGDSSRTLYLEQRAIMPNLRRRNKILCFVIAHEMMHAIRDHFHDTVPFGSRMHERSADLHGLMMSLRAEEFCGHWMIHSDESTIINAKLLDEVEKHLLLTCVGKGQDGVARWMRYVTREYIIACKVFFATVHILERTIGCSRLARARERTHPTPRQRAFLISLTHGRLAPSFCGRRITFTERYVRGRCFWRFAWLFLSYRGSYLRRLVRENDRVSWEARGSHVALALKAFS